MIQCSIFTHNDAVNEWIFTEHTRIQSASAYGALALSWPLNSCPGARGPQGTTPGWMVRARSSYSGCSGMSQITEE